MRLWAAALLFASQLILMLCAVHYTMLYYYRDQHRQERIIEDMFRHFSALHLWFQIKTNFKYADNLRRIQLYRIYGAPYNDIYVDSLVLMRMCDMC